jgi:hypothetical protein
MYWFAKMTKNVATTSDALDDQIRVGGMVEARGGGVKLSRHFIQLDCPSRTRAMWEKAYLPFTSFYVAMNVDQLSTSYESKIWIGW